jgi:hypothetical protein
LAGDSAWLPRRHVRPQLRCAPKRLADSGLWTVASLPSAAEPPPPVSPPPHLPVRLPLGISPAEGADALGRVLGGIPRGGMESVTLGQLSRALERELMPTMPQG